MIINLFIILFILIIIIIIIYYFYCKEIDKEDFTLAQTLNQWERPYNNNNEGYYNLEPTGIPPLVPIL